MDPRALTEPERAGESGVAHAGALLAFADAAVHRDAEALPAAREALRRAVGDAGLVEAAGVVANFQRMVRIADGTGIPLDTPTQALSADLQHRLGLERFASAANTPGLRGAGRALAAAEPVARGVLRLLGRLRGRRRR